jgi:YVTN family beta-propeller protein
MRTKHDRVALVAVITLFSLTAGRGTSGAAWQYVPDPLRSLVLIVDPEGQRVIGTLPTELPSRNLVVDRAHQRLYVANTGWIRRGMEPGTVTVWRVPDEAILAGSSASPAFLDSYEPIARIPVGRGPLDVALDASGSTLFVANAGGDSISVVDVWKASVVSTFAVGGQPASVVQHPQSKLLYVARLKAEDVAVLDPSTGDVLTTVPVDGGAIDVVIQGDGDRIYAGSPRTGRISEIDPKTNAVVRTIPIGGYPTRMIARGGHLYAIDLIGGFLTLVSAAEGQIRERLHVGNAPDGLAVDEDTGAVVTSSFKTASVTMADRDVSRIAATIPRAYLAGVRR